MAQLQQVGLGSCFSILGVAVTMVEVAIITSKVDLSAAVIAVNGYLGCSIHEWIVSGPFYAFKIEDRPALRSVCTQAPSWMQCWMPRQRYNIMSHAAKWHGMKSADCGKLSQGKQGNTKPMRLSRPSLHPLLHP